MSEIKEIKSDTCVIKKIRQKGNDMITNHRLADGLRQKKIITDGSFGTYYSDKYQTDDMPELANMDADREDRVLTIHQEYIDAGAGLIRTNTFAANTVLLNADSNQVKENIKAAIRLAKEAVGSKGCYIAGDIGPIPIVPEISAQEAEEQYYQLGHTFVENGIDILTFETFSELTSILPAIKKLKNNAVEMGKPLFVMVQFSVNQFGYSAAGLSARKLLSQAAQVPEIDAVGLNCGVGPGHMEQIMSGLKLPADKYLISLPNAGYPERIRNRIRFANHPEYFVTKATELIQKDGVDIIGGCCGTTPEFIRLLSQSLDVTQKPKEPEIEVRSEAPESVQNRAFFHAKLQADKHENVESGNGKFQSGKLHTDKLIAVELAPPVGSDDEKLLKAAHMLEDLGVDVLTFPDSPSGRTRIDSVLMAEKVHRETGMCVMPHICCRDKNAIAMRSTFLGAHINDIHNFLIITGDPVPTMARQTIKAVFNFDSVGLMNIARDMNEENFSACPLTYGGAINQGRKNLEVEIGRVKKKMEAGAQFFLTQPVFTQEDADRVRRIKEETGAHILCGIMPLISRKNALFMKNEIAGVLVTDEIVARYPENATKAEGEAVGIRLAKEIMEITADFADGYYFSFPFNRVHMLKEIMN